MEKKQRRYDPSLDYYHILGITSGASAAEIKKALKQAAKKYHPDVNRQNEAWATRRFQRVNEAYGVLIDPASRLQYDRERWKSLAKGKIAVPPEMEIETPTPLRPSSKNPDRMITYAFLAMFGLMILVLFGIILADAALKAFGFK